MSCDPITKEKALEMFNHYLAAEATIAGGGKSYSIGSRSLTRADETFIQQQLQYWRGQYMRFCVNGHGGMQARSAIPHG